MFDAYIPWVLGTFLVAIFAGQALHRWWQSTEWKRRRQRPDDDD
ncbi:MAG TPA: hypothetical protein VFA27_12985 [Vicinamibacterales bacterium]|nr:hypothetical protein [Vicinamibacterales bacterium]